VREAAMDGRLLQQPINTVKKTVNGVLPQAYPGFYNGEGPRGGGWARGSGRQKSPSGVWGKAPVGSLGDNAPGW